MSATKVAEKRQGRGNTYSHSATIRLGIHWLARFAQRSQQLEVIDVESRSVGVEELCGLVVGIREGVGRARWDGDVVSEFRVDGLAVEAVEAQCTLSD